MMPEYGGSGTFPIPSEMKDSDISRVREGFVQAAARAQHAGFDGVEVHAANGYLLDQFNTVYSNLRTDRYGGSPRNRIRFTAEIVEAIREALPNDFIIGVRVSEAKVNDFEYRWPGGREEAATIFGSLAVAGASYLHVAGEGRGFRSALEASSEPLTSLARRVTGLPVIANGGLHELSLANRVIQEGHADLIAIGRAALANPDLPRRIARGLPIHQFDHEMLSPMASLENADRWQQKNSQDVTCPRERHPGLS
jgi:2,4-dienoyl-CoA reductase-like NADH-dependent reductase (Old Yellow Enzyme family)